MSGRICQACKKETARRHGGKALGGIAPLLAASGGASRAKAGIRQLDVGKGPSAAGRRTGGESRWKGSVRKHTAFAAEEMRMGECFCIEAHFVFAGEDFSREILFAEERKRGIYGRARERSERGGKIAVDILGAGMVATRCKICIYGNARARRPYAVPGENFVDVR